MYGCIGARPGSTPEPLLGPPAPDELLAPSELPAWPGSTPEPLPGPPAFAELLAEAGMYGYFEPGPSSNNGQPSRGFSKSGQKLGL